MADSPSKTTRTLVMHEVVVPLFALSDGRYAHAGTGFVIRHASHPMLLVTANHVGDYAGGHLGESGNLFAHEAPDLGRRLATGEIHQELLDTSLNMRPLTLLSRSTAHDLAVYKPELKNSIEPLDIAPVGPETSKKVASYECSRTSVQKEESNLVLSPSISTRVGNVVRYIGENPGLWPEGSMELSFPALKGASGAPLLVLEGDNHGMVCGVIIANAQFELLPVQTYRYIDPQGAAEETTHYYLPAGVAIHVKWLHELLSKL